MFYLKFKQQFLASDKHSALFTSVLIYRYLNLLKNTGGQKCWLKWYRTNKNVIKMTQRLINKK